MTISGVNGVNTQIGQMGMDQATDSYSRNIQNQIANAQKQLQEMSATGAQMETFGEVNESIEEVNKAVGSFCFGEYITSRNGSNITAESIYISGYPGIEPEFPRPLYQTFS